MIPTVVVITGLSGSGKTVALRALEDEGFFCVDNLPVTLMESFVTIITTNAANTRIGIGIDIREKEFLHSVGSVLKSLREKCRVEIVFFEADRDTIIRRFKETRRPHPLVSGDLTIDDAIIMERTLLSPLRGEAERIVDTASFTPHYLRQLVISFFRSPGPGSKMTLTLISFGYKFGVPHNIDLLFDVRFIPNPYFVPELKPLKGIDISVKDFIFNKPSTMEFVERTAGLLNFLIPQYIDEGKSYLTIGFGCTGGRHRSPAIVEKIASDISSNPVSMNIIHRDIDL